MARQFNIPNFYKSKVISRIKKCRQVEDPRKQDVVPTVLDFGPVRFVLARHFGFCFGVENAVEIAYRTLSENSGRRIFFLSEMIHNPDVNRDLQERGVRFIFSSAGDHLIGWDELNVEDIVVVPAFGASVEVQEALAERGLDPYTYNTTCPFVERVWKRSAQLGNGGYTVVVHGKASHEETRATFSHSIQNAPTVVVRNLEEARLLSDIIRQEVPPSEFFLHFGHKCSTGFDPLKDLQRLGVVNQTTMLASETRQVAQFLKDALSDRYGRDLLDRTFADTSDTLCYATNENQHATYALIDHGADLSLVVGGYNSSNTSHIVELCEKAMPTYFIQGEKDILSKNKIHHFALAGQKVMTSAEWLPEREPIDIALTCGASCPDAVVDDVLLRVLSFFKSTRSMEEVLQPYPETESYDAGSMDSTG